MDNKVPVKYVPDYKVSVKQVPDYRQQSSSKISTILQTPKFQKNKYQPTDNKVPVSTILKTTKLMQNILIYTKILYTHSLCTV